MKWGPGEDSPPDFALNFYCQAIRKQGNISLLNYITQLTDCQPGCGGYTVVVLLWWGYCGGDTVVVLLLWFCCGGGIVVLVLWWCCGSGGDVGW